MGQLGGNTWGLVLGMLRYGGQPSDGVGKQAVRHQNLGFGRVGLVGDRDFRVDNLLMMF